jgi:long-chain acyl-CoA synthetase
VALMDDPMMAPMPTLPERFVQSVAQRAGQVAMRWKRLGLWQDISWDTWGRQASSLGLALLSSGLSRGDRVAVLAATRPESLYVEFGALGTGILPVSLFPGQSRAELVRALQQSAARMLFVGDQEQLFLALPLLEEVPALERIVYMDGRGLHAFSHPRVSSFEAFQDTGQRLLAIEPDRWMAEVTQAKAQDPALWISTSGTSGPARGMLITHHALLVQLDRLAQTVVGMEGDWQLSLLPMGLVLERCLTLYRCVMQGSVIHLGEGMPAARENLREVSAQLVVAVPWLWTRLHATVQQAVDRATATGRWGYRLTLGVGERMDALRQAGKAPSLPLRMLDALLGRTVRRRILALIGLQRARCLVSTGAPIPDELVRWYRAMGLDFLDVYGSAESSGFAALLGAGHGANGQILRLGAQGEILLLGDHLAQSPDGVRADGMPTGDVGEFQSEGGLRVIGRLVERITLANGLSLMPGDLEASIRRSPYIADAVLVGHGREALSCLVLIDHERVADFAQKREIPFSNFTSLTRLAEVRKLVQDHIDSINSSLHPDLRISATGLMTEELMSGDEMLSPVLSLRREVVIRRYAVLIDSLYAGSDSTD